MQQLPLVMAGVHVLHMPLPCAQSCTCILAAVVAELDSILAGVTKKHEDRNDRKTLKILCCRTEADVMQFTPSLDCKCFVCLQQKSCIHAVILTLGGAAAALSTSGLPCFGRSAIWG